MTKQPLPPEHPTGRERLLGVLALAVGAALVLGVALWAYGALP